MLLGVSYVYVHYTVFCETTKVMLHYPQHNQLVLGSWHSYQAVVLPVQWPVIDLPGRNKSWDYVLRPLQTYFYLGSAYTHKLLLTTHIFN